MLLLAAMPSCIVIPPPQPLLPPQCLHLHTGVFLPYPHPSPRLKRQPPLSQHPQSCPPPPAVLPSGTTDQLAGKTLSLDKTKKLRKEKQAKKSKTKMPSLVKKWQSIQRELDEEEKSSSSDEDRDQFNSRRIEEWKQQQFVTGKAGKNANFEALPEDWRERLLKKRKLTQTI
uniref:Uncharacterized protein n=1 Tax=Anguilla anguilla TaxID=7936 RepID=A0A0E9X3H1_ANGAN